jgi:sugar lactone lactonase YvrE
MRTQQDLLLNPLKMLAATSLWLLPFTVPSQPYYHLVQAWETDAVFATPESAVFDAKRNQIYVSNYNTFPRDLASADDFISVLDLEGNVLHLRWITGLKAPTGITIYNDHLFVVERDGIGKYRIESGALIEKLTIPSPGFPNDIAIDEDGTVYFTDTSPRQPESSAVYAIRKGRVDTVANDPINRSNGLLYDRGSLLVGNSGDRYLKQIDLVRNQVTEIARLDTGIIDGIKLYKPNHYIVTLWEGRIYLILSNGTITELLDLRSHNIKTADIEYIPEQKLLIIPTFDHNRVIAYRLEEEQNN